MVGQLKFSKGYWVIVLYNFTNYTLLITGLVTRLIRRVPLVDQELLTLPEHLSSHPVFSGVRVTRSFFVRFSFGNCVSVLLRYMDSDNPIGIFKLFLKWILIKLINYYHFSYSNLQFIGILLNHLYYEYQYFETFLPLINCLYFLYLSCLSFDFSLSWWMW